MGLNLPIKTILFTTDEKFDGKSRRKITVNEIVQMQVEQEDMDILKLDI